MSYDDPEYWDACDEHESTYPKGGACTACLQAEITQLRGNLSLAEEGLANYQQENERLRNEIRTANEAIEALNKKCGALAFLQYGSPPPQSGSPK
jgi:septal ring factor EnvC (AmiA/AmiB activator)